MLLRRGRLSSGADVQAAARLAGRLARRGRAAPATALLALFLALDRPELDALDGRQIGARPDRADRVDGHDQP
jgi:hypothetical protein